MMSHYKYIFTDSLQSLMIVFWIFQEVREYFRSNSFHSVRTKTFHSVTTERENFHLEVASYSELSPS